jgi:hypothetical protein
MLVQLRKLNNELKEMSKREGEKWSFKMKSDEQTAQLMRNNLTDSMQLLKEERLKRSKLEGEVSTMREKVYVLVVLCVVMMVPVCVNAHIRKVTLNNKMNQLISCNVHIKQLLSKEKLIYDLDCNLKSQVKVYDLLHQNYSKLISNQKSKDQVTWKNFEKQTAELSSKLLEKDETCHLLQV